MPFGAKLQPNVRPQIGPDEISVKIKPNGGHGATRTIFSFGFEVAAKVRARTFDAQEGTGADKGRVLLTFGDDGAFKVNERTDRKHRTVYLVLPVLHCVPEGFEFSPERAPFRWHTEHQLEISLPVDRWEKAAKEAS